MIKEIILLILLVFSNCKTDVYYTKCKDGAPNGNNFATASECKEYSTDNSHCCLLYYDVKDQNVQFSIFRNLNERVNVCYGLTKDGYYNIDKVIKELKDESGVDNLQINCFSSNIKFIYGFIVLLFLIF